MRVCRCEIKCRSSSSCGSLKGETVSAFRSKRKLLLILTTLIIALVLAVYFLRESLPTNVFLWTSSLLTSLKSHMGNSSSAAAVLGVLQTAYEQSQRIAYAIQPQDNQTLISTPLTPASAPAPMLPPTPITSSRNRSEQYVMMIPDQEDVLSSAVEKPQFACDETNSPNYMIYCQGELLHAVMMLNIFKDSKTFVDKPLKRDPEIVAAEFKDQFPGTITSNDREAVREFVNANFNEEGHELEECELVDWQKEPEQLLSIEDPDLRQFALQVNLIWKKLCRTIKKEVVEHPRRHSLIYVPNEFVVPGGRFREFYYWDTYWVIKGLLASGMHQTCKKMILNFHYLVDTIGFIPNGGRVYYLRRSQPPMFIPMIYEYHMATEDDEFLLSMLNSMEKVATTYNRKVVDTSWFVE
uniref:Trehalase n=1 Tax=Parascaris univalens TaxID=6257 RepID=A0A914ZJK5_PARUN